MTGLASAVFPMSGSLNKVVAESDAAGRLPGRFRSLPLGAIRPKGWLKAQLELQANSLSGHLDETWLDVGPTSGWLGGSGESWERGPYYLDGLIPLAYLLDDRRLKDKAQRYIDWTLKSQTNSGMFGPPDNPDWWPRMVMLKALVQYQEASDDPRVIPMMTKYLHYMFSALPAQPLKSWGKFRWQDQVLTVLWLYRRTADPVLLQLANLLHMQGYDWKEQYANFKYTERMSSARIESMAMTPGFKDAKMSTHGVNNAQAVKTGAIWSQVSGLQEDRSFVLQMIAALERYHGLPNGMFSCDEHLAGRNPSQGSELCAIVEYMFSLEQALAILGEPSLGDRLELLAFNALPGAMTDDMWAHQYDQQPNQVECSLHSQPWTTNGPESNLYGLEPNFGCCTANFNQGWPKFATSLMMSAEEEGVVVATYAPCEAHIPVKGTIVHIVEETEYPFRGTVKLSLTLARPVAFPLILRIPDWAIYTEISVNGRKQRVTEAGSFTRLQRDWTQGDIVEIVFAMQPRIVSGYHGSVSIRRGPLVFAYNIGEGWLNLRDRGMTADWEIYPKSRWNYALEIDPSSQSNNIEVVEGPLTDAPFTSKTTPVELHVAGKQLPSWVAVDGVAGDLPESPIMTEEKIETIKLIPYAAAKLRITSFPHLGRHTET